MVSLLLGGSPSAIVCGAMLGMILTIDNLELVSTLMLTRMSLRMMVSIEDGSALENSRILVGSIGLAVR